MTTPSTEGVVTRRHFTCPAILSGPLNVRPIRASYVKASVIFLSLFEGPDPRMALPASEPGVCRSAPVIISVITSGFSDGKTQIPVTSVHEPAHADVHHDPQREKHEQY